MTSTLKLYYNSKILYGKNFCVDDIETYLATLTKKTILDFQYQRHQLYKTIKIDETQTSLEFLNENNINYCSIQNGLTGEIVYYYVVGKTWRAKSTIELSLVLDTINSFNSSVDLSEKTMILRQHKDRWEQADFARFELEEHSITGYESEVIYSVPFSYLQSCRATVRDLSLHGMTLYFLTTARTIMQVVNNVKAFSFSVVGVNRLCSMTLMNGETLTRSIPPMHRFGFLIHNVDDITTISPYGYVEGTLKEIYNYNPLIDFYSEGINAILYKTKEQGIYDQYDEDEEHNSFYLISRNSTDDEQSSIDTFLCSDEEMHFVGNSNFTGYISQASYNYKSYYYLFFYGADNPNGKIRVLDNQLGYITFELTSSDMVVIEFMKDDKKFKATTAYKGTIAGDGSFSLDMTYSSADGSVLLEDITKAKFYKNVFVSDFSLTNYNSASNETTISAGTYDFVCDPISKIDRSNVLLSKIIKLPYAPALFEKRSDGTFILDNNWSSADYDGTHNLLRLKTIGNENFLENKITCLYEESPFAPLKKKTINKIRIKKDYEYETKLLHSDYYQPKFVYDSFSFIFNLEKITEFTSDYFNFTFLATKNFASKFMFIFDDYQLKYSTEDYDNLLSIARNNEIVIYNSSYMQYLKTGYNYDLKTKERQETTSMVSTAINLGSSSLSTIQGMATGKADTAQTAFSIARLGFSASNAIFNQIQTRAQNEANIQQKLLQSKMQGVSVSGSDDIDLLTYYTGGNKAKICYYELSAKMKELVFDLFYYTGYIANFQALPDTTSRSYFNYVQAEVVYNSVPNLPSEIVEDLTAKYKEGITFLHHYNNEWDFEQELENWETSIV